VGKLIRFCAPTTITWTSEVNGFRLLSASAIGIERPLGRSGLGTFRKATFGVGLELPSDTSDKVLLVAAPAILAEERFETLDHFGDCHRFEACDLGRRCSVHV
jgi:hypothetical protein